MLEQYKKGIDNIHDTFDQRLAQTERLARTAMQSAGAAASSVGTLGTNLDALEQDFKDLNGSVGEFEGGARSAADMLNKKAADLRENSANTAVSMQKFLAVMNLLRTGMDLAVGVTEQYHEKMGQYADSMRVGLRGTTLLGENLTNVVFDGASKAMKIQKDFGYTAAESTALMSAAQEALSRARRFEDMDTEEIDAFADSLAATSRLTGTSTATLSEFNKTLLTTMSLAPETAANITTMIIDAGTKFGLSGDKVVQTIAAHQDRILALDADQREEFIGKLLTTAGAFERAGVDFGRYTKSLTESRGVDTVEQAAELAAFSGRSYEDVLNAIIGARNNDAKAIAELLEISKAALNSVVDLEAIQAGHQKSVSEKGFGSDTVARNAYNQSRIDAETIVGPLFEKLGLTLDNVLALKGQEGNVADAAREAEEMPVEAVSPSDYKDTAEEIRTRDEAREAAIGAYYSTLDKAARYLGMTNRGYKRLDKAMQGVNSKFAVLNKELGSFAGTIRTLGTVVASVAVLAGIKGGGAGAAAMAGAIAAKFVAGFAIGAPIGAAIGTAIDHYLVKGFEKKAWEKKTKESREADALSKSDAETNQAQLDALLSAREAMGDKDSLRVMQGRSGLGFGAGTKALKELEAAGMNMTDVGRDASFGWFAEFEKDTLEAAIRVRELRAMQHARASNETSEGPNDQTSDSMEGHYDLPRDNSDLDRSDRSGETSAQESSDLSAHKGGLDPEDMDKLAKREDFDMRTEAERESGEALAIKTNHDQNTSSSGVIKAEKSGPEVVVNIPSDDVKFQEQLIALRISGDRLRSIDRTLQQMARDSFIYRSNPNV